MRITEKRLRSIIRNVIAESESMSAKEYEDERYNEFGGKLPPNKEEIAQELEREGHKDLADHLRGIWSKISDVFAPLPEID